MIQNLRLKEKLRLLKMELKMMMNQKMKRKSSARDKILTSRMLNLSLLKRRSRRCKSRKKKIKQITSKRRLKQEEESDLEIEEERNQLKEELIGQICIKSS